MDFFENFLYSFGAARKLLERAYHSGSLIEGIVLYVSLIDGLLRIALILDKQLRDDTSEFDLSYVEQKPSGPKYTERQIFEEAYKHQLIDETLKRSISDLYEKRNSLIHRFFLTDLKYADLEPWLDRYEEIYDKCYEIVDGLEKQQIRESKGMVRTGPDADKSKVLEAVNQKLGISLDPPTPST